MNLNTKSLPLVVEARPIKREVCWTYLYHTARTGHVEKKVKVRRK
jgi:hypothetical protein